MFEAPEQDPYEGMEGIVSNISTQQIDFDELTHSIVISGINARVGVDDPDMENAYATFKIWILDATDVNDENNAKVITTFQAFVRNGQLILEGNMSANDFTAQNNKAIYTLTGLTRTISIPQNISLDDVIVKVGADLGNLGDGINPEYSLNFNQQKYAGANKEIHDNARFQIDILGNPASGNLNFVVANGKRKYTSATIDVYSCDGKLVKHVYDGELANLSKDFCIDISSLPTGNYYLSTVTDTKEKFTRKFIKQ
jgi:hypothetical protein